MKTSEWKKLLCTGKSESYFSWLYPNTASAQEKRYADAIEQFELAYGERDILIFSAPGRTELGGNHTDHQQGRVLAASVSMDMVAVVSPRLDSTVHFMSRGYKTDTVDIRTLTPQMEEKNTSASLIRGVAARFDRLGYSIGGFDAYQISDVPKGSGLSSSAAFEVLIGTIFSGVYNGGKIPAPVIAQIGQYAENVFFGKPSGLMDQTASAVGGVVAIDFFDPKNPVIEQVSCSFDAAGYSLCIVDAGGSHADLTEEYASIPGEMKTVAAQFGKPVLSQVEESQFYARLGALRTQVSDRALLRAMHFFGESACVRKQIKALSSNDMASFLDLMIQSGRSSLGLLQNVFPSHSAQERSVALALALAEHLLHGRGAWRVHGGGFAGTIQALVPHGLFDTFTSEMEKVFGQGCCHLIAVRPVGGVMLTQDFRPL